MPFWDTTIDKIPSISNMYRKYILHYLCVGKKRHLNNVLRNEASFPVEKKMCHLLKKKSHNDKNISVYHNRTDDELHTNTEFKLRTADFVYLANSFLWSE